MLASCSVETQYVPRTPHAVALGIKNHQLALYKDGALLAVGEAGAMIRCPPAMADLSAAADHAHAARVYSLVGGVITSVGYVMLPAFPVGSVFTALGIDRERAAEAALVDAVNRHNDAADCVQ